MWNPINLLNEGQYFNKECDSKLTIFNDRNIPVLSGEYKLANKDNMHFYKY